MSFEIIVNNRTVNTIQDEILAIAYIFMLLKELKVRDTDISIRNTTTGKTETLHEWTNTPIGEDVI